MEQIITNLQNPSWWFTGVFFIILGFFLKYLVFSWLPWAWRKLSKFMPEIAENLSNRREKHILLSIKNNRQRPMKINWLIGRYWFSVTFTFLYFVFVVVSFLTTDLLTEEPLNRRFYFFLVFLPGYISMFLTILEKKKLFRIMNAHHLWNKHITSQSARTQQSCAGV